MPKSYIGGFQKVSKNRGMYDDDELPNKKKNKPNRSNNRRSTPLPIQDNQTSVLDDFYEDYHDNEY
ncbi:hypothetical protein FDH01_gp109 [Acinetobacter phage vB_AbaM_ME3]|uniref:Uncharacterized protein n=1 Tax=Acinetobacter phage vB_AbaM_ME3 TaxID=1837876 RepID=A0A172Q082_9CAUD|nr:hypothetical protein FDH01_gp109 [Acinetobacter phage vB_AbaM_ME3]AND75270.1 hypothetical protein ME3_109 [Acinetobacter phage vB_AbaM_ME3]